MKRYGYHRTSTREQHLDRGINEITAYCEQNNLELEKIFTDQHTGKNFNRPRYQVLKEDVLRAGDELIITEVDRLGRNKQETLKELQYYRDNGIRVKILELPTTLMDLSKLDNAMARMLMETINNMLIELYAAMAQAEIEKKEKRQREGIDSKKARGEWDDYGRPAVMSLDEFSEHYQNVMLGEIRPFELMKQLGMSKSTYYRYVKRIKEQAVYKTFAILRKLLNDAAEYRSSESNIKLQWIMMIVTILSLFVALYSIKNGDVINEIKNLIEWIKTLIS